MTDTKETSAERLAGCALLLLLWPVGFVVWGAAAVHLWGWYVLPLFPGAIRFSAPQAVGASLFLTLVRGPGKWPDDSNTTLEEVGRAFGRTVAFPALLLLSGWLVQRAWL